MNGRVTKARRSQRSLLSRSSSEAVQDRLFEAAAAAAVTEVEATAVVSSPVEATVTQPTATETGAAAQPLHLTPSKRPAEDCDLDGDIENDRQSTKKARLSGPAVDTNDVKQFVSAQNVTNGADKATPAGLHEPRPRSWKHGRASFLEPYSVDNHPPPAYDFVSEWIESVGAYREKHCQSDGHVCSDLVLHPSLIRRTRSAPEMSQSTRGGGRGGSDRFSDRFPQVTPPSTVPSRVRSLNFLQSGASSASGAQAATSSGRTLVEDRHYRGNLEEQHNIHFRPRFSDKALPAYVDQTIQHVARKRDSPGPSLEDLEQDRELYALDNDGLDESQVSAYFEENVFTKPEKGSGVFRSFRQNMHRHHVPVRPGANCKISTPVPDLAFGYRRNTAFPHQGIQMESESEANNDHLLFPFFVIEFKGASGNIWVAENQCLGGSATCVNIAEKLNHKLRECSAKTNSVIQTVDNTAFSVAMDGTRAHLHISWKDDDLNYYMHRFGSFFVQEPQDHLKFRNYVRNIIDWGADKRLKDIQRSLDTLLEESRKQASRAAKSRSPPPLPDMDAASASGSKRPRAGSGLRRVENASPAHPGDEHPLPEATHQSGYAALAPPQPQPQQGYNYGNAYGGGGHAQKSSPAGYGQPQQYAAYGGYGEYGQPAPGSYVPTASPAPGYAQPTYGPQSWVYGPQAGAHGQMQPPPWPPRG